MKNWSKYGIYVPLGKTTGRIRLYCPKCHDNRHNKTDKSLSVDLDTGLFNCFYCGYAGNVNEYSDDEKKDWAKMQSWYKPQFSGSTKQVYRKPKVNTSTMLSEKLLTWFKGRGISENTVSAMRISEGLEYMPQKQKNVNTVQFNYFLDGELVNAKYRTGDKCFKLVQGARLIPYNIESIKDTTECIITEGEMDTLSFIECGRNDCISVPNGANANLTYLDDFLDDYFDNKETIYIAVDTDTKGVLLKEELIRRFGAERCKVVTYGADCKDANEHLQKYGKESLLKCLANATDIKLEGIFYLSDIEENLDALYENGLMRGVTIGHENFDNLCSFETKRLCIVTGIPGSGKSEFIDEIAERLNVRYGWRFAYFSPENAPLSYHASKLIEKFTGKKFEKKTLTNAEYNEAKEHIERDFFFISPSDNFKLEAILERGKYLVRRKGIKVLVIDPYNRLESEQGSKSETQYISEILDRLTNFAQQNNVLVILMAHPTKMPKNKDGSIEPPSLYDISGSANFFNKADFGIVVHRNIPNSTVDVYVQKVKFKHLGERGTATFKYNINNGRYVPYDSVSSDLGCEIAWDNTNHLRKLQETDFNNNEIEIFQNIELPF